MKPDFDQMSVADLRSYLLLHRGDDEAFYQLVDRLESGSETTELYPYPDTPETIAITEQAIQEYVKKLEERKG